MAAPASGTESGWTVVGPKRRPNSLPPPVEENKGEIAVDGAKRPVSVSRDVHRDDIHAFLYLKEKGTFISGSKDGSLKEWDLNLKQVQVIYQPDRVHYQSWITALSRLGKNHWVSGTRDGYVHLFDSEGRVIQEIERAQRRRNDPKCKVRNVSRINCLADLTHFGEGEKFVSGRPTQFALYGKERSEFRVREIVETSQNDWVYAVDPLTPSSLLVVTGGRLDLLEIDRDWRCSTLMDELPPPEGVKQRAFISSVTRLQSEEHLAGLSIFNGNVVIYDLHANQPVFHAKEHEKRVWTIENIAPFSFATCADDGLIKLWDHRQENSVATMRDNLQEPARVSVLLSTNEHQLISGSCPDDLKRSKEKARFSLWDLRRV